MKSISIVLLVIAGVILLGLGYTLGKIALQQEYDEIFTLLPHFPLTKEWRSSAGGEVLEITGEAITISFEESTLRLALPENVEVIKTIQNKDEVLRETEGLSSQDINVGDTVSVVVLADTAGNLTANLINIFEFQEE